MRSNVVKQNSNKKACIIGNDSPIYLYNLGIKYPKYAAETKIMSNNEKIFIVRPPLGPAKILYLNKKVFLPGQT